MQDRQNDEQAPEGTGNRGTSWYYSRKYDVCADSAEQAIDEQESSDLVDRANYYYGLGLVRGVAEQDHRLKAGMTPNEAAAHDLQYATEAPEGERQAEAERLGFDYTEEEIGGIVQDVQRDSEAREAAREEEEERQVEERRREREAREAAELEEEHEREM